MSLGFPGAPSRDPLGLGPGRSSGIPWVPLGVPGVPGGLIGSSGRAMAGPGRHRKHIRFSQGVLGKLWGRPWVDFSRLEWSSGPTWDVDDISLVLEVLLRSAFYVTCKYLFNRCGFKAALFICGEEND